MIGMAWYPMTTYREGAISFSCLKEREVLQKPREVSKWSWPHHRSCGLSLRAVSIHPPLSKEAGREVSAPASLPPHPAESHPCFPWPELTARRSGSPRCYPRTSALWAAVQAGRGRDCPHGACKGLQTGLKWAHNGGICFAPAAGRTRSFIGNKDFLTIKNPVSDTFSALSSIKVLKIWTLDSS